MITVDNLNKKAMHEAILYYLQERMQNNNIELKHIIITNLTEFFIFDAKEFHKLFQQNDTIRNVFSSWTDHKTDDDSTKQMYDVISDQINEMNKTIETVHFTLNDFTKFNSKANKAKIKQLYQILSPRFLFKEAAMQDSNDLNKDFYNELLYIMGLEEYKEKNKKLIRRCEKSQSGSLLENTISQMKTHTITNPENYGASTEDQQFNYALQLNITWINRILFLKLLEAQLINYHNSDQQYAFLSSNKVRSYNDLADLFFKVLALKEDERQSYIIENYPNLPYLNSSLFDRSSQEQEVSITELTNLEISIYSKTVLKTGKRRISGKMNTLEYLLRFLDAFNFGSKIIPEEEKKTLINASVLGLIFEKINGYKEGSFYTPGYITMYMSRETLRRSVLDKLNTAFERNFTEFDELKNYTNNIYKSEELQKANDVLNSITICDPAVGSGHFLVSVLNEMIAVKSELGILCDTDAKPRRDWNIQVINDELNIHDGFGEPFEYKLNEANKPHSELQNIQETLFREKQTIIENCLFGVDINPNSVNICRLRLWIELLKNAYYTKESNFKYLHTLPNIDINIECGNSLISRFNLEDSFSTVLKKTNMTVAEYLTKVRQYKNATNKQEKLNLVSTINEIKSKFQKQMMHQMHVYRKFARLERKYNSYFEDQDMFEEDRKIKLNTKKFEQTEKAYNKAKAEWEVWESGEIYRNAFEWRFEFPEVLDDAGKFIGFDIVIGNPPWGAKSTERNQLYYKSKFRDIIVRMTDSFMFFVRNGLNLVKVENGIVSQIIPDVFLYQKDNYKLRKRIYENLNPTVIINLGDGVFHDVARASSIIIFKSNSLETVIGKVDKSGFQNLKTQCVKSGFFRKLPNNLFPTENINSYSILLKYPKTITDVIDVDGIQRGVSPDLQKAFIIDRNIINQFKIEESVIRATCTGGNDIHRFKINDNGKFLLYITKKTDVKSIPNAIKFIDQYKNEITCSEVKNGKHPYYTLHRSRDEKIFEKQVKILGVITSDKLNCALDCKRTYPSDGCFLFSLIDTGLSKFFIAILNSKLLTFFYQLLSFEKGRVLAQVKPTILSQLPLYNQLPNKYLVLITALYDKYQEYEKDKFIDSIDILTYKLYELTYAEVLIVDPEFALSKEEYENFKVE
jgi:adenine-specific DNA-methyltransferase